MFAGAERQGEAASTPLTSSWPSRQHQGNAPALAVRAYLNAITGADLTWIGGINVVTALQLISKIGLDMASWPTSKHFASWLGLCPGTKISGGKRDGARSMPRTIRAAAVLRLAAQSLSHSHRALGTYDRLMQPRLGAPAAITAAAHKLTRLLSSMLRSGTACVDTVLAALNVYDGTMWGYGLEANDHAHCRRPWDGVSDAIPAPGGCP